jgi:hypothetical protein
MKLPPTAFVIDRATAPKLITEFKELGGAWYEMLTTWQRLPMFPYLVLLAHTQERLRKGAPLTFMAIDDNALRKTLGTCCAQLDDIRCRWVICVEPNSTARSITTEMLLADSIVEGHT